MTVQSNVVISFAIPEEAQHAIKFEADNPKWVRHESSRYISFIKEDFYVVELQDVQSGDVFVG